MPPGGFTPLSEKRSFPHGRRRSQSLVLYSSMDRTHRRHFSWYPGAESNPNLSFRNAVPPGGFIPLSEKRSFPHGRRRSQSLVRYSSMDRTRRRHFSWYPGRESNRHLSFRNAVPPGGFIPLSEKRSFPHGRRRSQSLVRYSSMDRTHRRHFSWYPGRESNPNLSFRRALFYPLNYQGAST